ncbi:MBL fold metallo-hydrolase [Streptomyces sp. NPDC096311]|uniref:MBL fold metallo-hydrolase n=1 Tax=Streptomyces sp. NPDC096311 TaxID=3366083 RepID=UPI003822AA63
MASLSSLLPRHDGSALVVGWPATVLDLGGLRIVSASTVDALGFHGYLIKTQGPALVEDRLADVDLVSHGNHADNFDDSGRAVAPVTPLPLTATGSADRLGAPAKGLAARDTHTCTGPDGGELIVTPVAAAHGPDDGERDADGEVNCQFVGFILTGDGLPTVYSSGANASTRTVTEITPPAPHASRAQVPRASRQPRRRPRRRGRRGPRRTRQHPRPYTGWAHFAEGPRGY